MREQARNKYTELSNKEKNIKREYGRNRYQNMSEENKQRLSFIFFASHSIKNGAKSLIINVLIKMYLVKIKDQLVLIK